MGRISKGIGAQGIQQGVQICIRIVEVPLLLSAWGPQLYGEWLMLSAIPEYLSIGDGGFAAAACREMTMRSGSGDKQGTLAVYQSTGMLLAAISLFACLAGLGAMRLLPLANWLGFLVTTQAEVNAILFLLLLHVLIGFQGGLIMGGFWVEAQYPTGMYFQAGTQILEFSGLVTAVAFGGGPVQAAAGYLIGRTMGTILTWIGQMRSTPWLRFGVSHASLVELRNLTGPAFASLAFPLGNALNIQGMRLIVGLVLGATAVAVFSPLRTLSRLAIQPRTVINRLIQPEMALAFGSDDSDVFHRLFLKASQFATWGTAGVCLVVGVLARWIFPAWTNGRVAIDWPTLVILLAGVLVNGIWYTAMMVPYATNRHGSTAIFYTLIYGAGALLLAYVGSVKLGIAGTAIALFVSEVAMAIVVLKLSLHMAGLDVSAWLQVAFRPPIGDLSAVAAEFYKRIKVAAQGMVGNLTR